MADRKMDGVIKNVGKGSKEEELPNRFARANFTGGDMMNRYRNNYAKKTPKSDMGVSEVHTFTITGRGF